MKYVILIGDGMADYHLDELNGKTPLQAANTPNFDKLAKMGCSGLLKTVPDNMTPGSDVANLSLMGYNPADYYTGRGPLEAANLGIDLSNEDVVFRCNFITREDDILEDFNAGHITSHETKQLIDELNENFKDIGTFYHGVSYRNIFVYNKTESAKLESVPPHDVTGDSLSQNMLKPFGDENAIILNKLMEDSEEVLINSDINKKRQSEGKKIANRIWLWGQGTKPQIDTFHEKYGLNGATITGVDLIKGLGVYLGFNNINVPGATGYFDTDYNAKGEYAVDAIDKFDILFIHVEAPDEAGHAGDIEEKIKAVENIDEKILAPVMKKLEEYDEYAIVLTPDHPTPIPLKTHSMDLIPFTVYITGIESDKVEKYDEDSAKEGVLGIKKGYDLINCLINGF